MPLPTLRDYETNPKTAMTNDDRHLAMFFSVDIKNSTSTKERKIKDTFIWPHFYKAFYEAFPEALRKAFDGEAFTPEPWKANGDELLFCCDLPSKRISKAGEIVENFLLAANSVQSAIKRMRKNIENIKQKSKPVDFDVDLKCTVWCAPVPHRNLILKLENTTDYIGPEIDLGFRLSAHSTPKHPAICPITALLLFHHRCPQYKVLFNGLHTLKGFSDPVPIHLLSKDSIAGFEFEYKLQHRTSLTTYLEKMCPKLIIPGVRPFHRQSNLTPDNMLEEAIGEVMRRSFFPRRRA